MVDMKFEGGKELEKALMELTTAAAKSVARRVLKRHAQPVADTANRLAPTDKGNLNESYLVSGKLNKNQRRATRKTGKDDVTVYAGTNNPAGMQQEFGNARHGAQPHLRPAWDQKKVGVLQGITEDMAIEVEKSVKRARRKALK